MTWLCECDWHNWKDSSGHFGRPRPRDTARVDGASAMLGYSCSAEAGARRHADQFHRWPTSRNHFGYMLALLLDTFPSYTVYPRGVTNALRAGATGSRSLKHTHARRGRTL